MKMPSTSSSLTSSRVCSGGGGSSSNRKQVWPPGFRFHPTDEELVLYYLKRKVCGKRLKLDIIAETDVYKWDPEDLPELSKLKTGDRLWFFFSPRDRKYPNAARSNRATHHGYWKATGKDRRITCNSRSVGLKKTLVFYKGRAPSGTRTDWVMHEYTLDEEELKRCQNVGDYYALYKVYKKSGPGPKNGEQYGAPFKEEEWVDDECTEVGFNSVEISNLSEPPDFQAVDTARVADKLVDETEGMWNTNSSGEISAIQLHSAEYADSFYQSFGDETKSATFDPPEQGPVVQSVSRQFELCVSFDYSQSAASQVVDVPDITSGLNIDELASILDDGDFLEANDLLGPEPIPSSEENPVANIRFDDSYDGLGEWDLFDDASMFLQENGANDLNSMFTEGHNKSNNFEVQPQLEDASVLTSELWGHQAQYRNDSAGVHSGSSLNGQITSIAGQQDVLNQNGSTSRPQNRVTSALWAFVESIPTTPASASENVIFNQALERVSSFRKTRLSAVNALTTAGTKEPVKNSKSKGILLFSVVGAVFAMLFGTRLMQTEEAALMKD